MMKKHEVQHAKRCLLNRLQQYRRASREELVAIWNERHPGMLLVEADRYELAFQLAVDAVEQLFPNHKIW